MERLKVSDLIPHPRNNEFFDDIKGDGWDDFLQSVRTSGVTNAITVDQRNVIISGHQRVRACKLLGIEEIPATRIEYTDEELNAEYPKDVKDLIESNMKQRVAGNANAVKLGKCVVFLEGYYGIKNGGDRRSNDFSSTNGGTEITQDDMIRELGLNKETYRRAKKLVSLPEEIQQAVEDGQISTSTAVRTIAKLPKEQQQKIADQILGGEKRYTDSEVRQLIKEHTTQENVNLQKENAALQQENLRLRNQKPTIKEVVSEEAQRRIDELERQLDDAKDTANRRLDEKKEAENELHKLKADIKKNSEDDQSEKYRKEIETGIRRFKAATYVYVRDFNEIISDENDFIGISEKDIRDFKTALYSLDRMVKQLIQRTGGYEII